jgi:hypothetical protein
MKMPYKFLEQSMKTSQKASKFSIFLFSNPFKEKKKKKTQKHFQNLWSCILLTIKSAVPHQDHDLVLSQNLIPKASTDLWISFYWQKNLKGTHQICFRILTLRTENKFFNESIQHVLQLIRLMRPIDNVTVILNIKLGLGSQLTTKIFGGIYLKKWFNSS